MKKSHLLHSAPLSARRRTIKQLCSMASSQPVEHSRLAVRNLHLWRGERHLLRGVSFEVQAGELLRVMGPNGVGKTSLLRCISGLLPVESGEIEWRGVTSARTFETLHGELAYLAHLNALKSDLTAAENLRYAVGLKRTVTTQELLATMERLQIGSCAELPVRALSAGQKRRVAIARVLLLNATLWVLDEPITNLDSVGIRLIEQCMDEHLSTGGMILAAAHQTLLDGSSRSRTLELH
jgi:heme exporter protein A